MLKTLKHPPTSSTEYKTMQPTRTAFSGSSSGSSWANCKSQKQVSRVPFKASFFYYLVFSFLHKWAVTLSVQSPYERYEGAWLCKVPAVYLLATGGFVYSSTPSFKCGSNSGCFQAEIILFILMQVNWFFESSVRKDVRYYLWMWLQVFPGHHLTSSNGKVPFSCSGSLDLLLYCIFYHV